MQGQEWSLINRFMRFQEGKCRPDFCVTPHSGDSGECAEQIDGRDVMRGEVEILVIFFFSQEQIDLEVVEIQTFLSVNHEEEIRLIRRDLASSVSGVIS